MHNLGTVFGFEVTRTLKKEAFGLPHGRLRLLYGVFFRLYFSRTKQLTKLPKIPRTSSLALLSQIHPALLHRNF